MSEYLGVISISPSLALYCFSVFIFVLIGLGIWIYAKFKSQWQKGFKSGKADLDGEMVRVGTAAFKRGHQKAFDEIRALMWIDDANQLKAAHSGKPKEGDAKPVTGRAPATKKQSTIVARPSGNRPKGFKRPATKKTVRSK